jgi:hypothetical protein
VSIDGYVVGQTRVHNTERGLFVVFRLKSQWSKAIRKDGQALEPETEADLDDYRVIQSHVMIEVACNKHSAEYAQHLKMGDFVGVTGSLVGRVYESRGGQKYTVQIRATHVFGVRTAHANLEVMKASELAKGIQEDGIDLDEPFI